MRGRARERDPTQTDVDDTEQPPDQKHSQQTTTFDESDSRADDMRYRLDAWVEDLADLTDEAQASEQFQRWLDVQSKFHDYSARNTLLIKMQCPEATRVAGYNTWKNEFDCYVQEGESAIWIWAPIITNKCSECGNSPSYHENTDCEYDETDPDEWSRGLVGLRPTSVFDISQTEGESLPELETETHGDPAGLVEDLLAATNEIGVDWNGIHLAALHGEYFTPHGYGTADHLSIRETVRESLEWIKRFWQDKGVWPNSGDTRSPLETEPMDPVWAVDGRRATSGALEDAIVVEYQNGQTLAFRNQHERDRIEYREGLTPTEIV
mgnify:CR=1 FL=1